MLLSLLVAAALMMVGDRFGRLVQPQIPDYLSRMGGDFSLQGASGPITRATLRGKAILLYFGYSHCPDACPRALALMARSMQQLPLRMQSRVAGLFVSLDPRRDTPMLLAGYCRFFDARIIGATGSTQALARMAAAWRVSYRVPDHPTRSDYVVDHSTFIYLLDPAGRTVALFNDQSSAEEIATNLRRFSFLQP
ncbi:MAG: SCO family protein [Mariprofundales bacterium]